jgi:hypothetical protein
MLHTMLYPPLRGCVEKPPSHAPSSSLKGMVGVRLLRYAGTRHVGIFHTIALCCSSSAGSFRAWFENVAAPSRSTVFGHTQARTMPSLLASPFSPNLHPGGHRRKHPRDVQTNRESFSFYRYIASFAPLKCTNCL